MIQNESHYFKVRCATVRSTTEWPESLVGDWNILIDSDEIYDTICNFNETSTGEHFNYYGDGDAGKHIANVIKNFLGSSNGN